MGMTSFLSLSLVSFYLFRQMCVVRGLTYVRAWVGGACGQMSRLRFTVYMMATALGLLPEIVLLCYAGTTLRSLQDLAGSGGHAPMGAAQWALLAAGIGVTVALFVLLWRLGHEAMREMDRSVSLARAHTHIQRGREGERDRENPFLHASPCQPATVPN
jgi:hypothetical protein